MNKIRCLFALVFFLFNSMPVEFVYAEGEETETSSDMWKAEKPAETEEPYMNVSKQAPAVKEKKTPVVKPSTKIPATDEEVTQSSDTITLELKNMDVVEVIKLLTSKGGFDVVISQNVRGRITLFLDNVPIWDALQIVLQTTELAYTMQNNIMRIVTEREFEQQYGKKFHDNREMKVIPIQYAAVGDISKDIKQLKSRIGSIIDDDRTNSLIVLDAPETIKDIEEAILKLDVPVETKVFELKFTSAKSLEDIMKKLITKKGLLYIDDATNKIIITDTQDVLKQATLLVNEYDKQQLLETRAFCLSYAKFDKVEEKIKDVLTKDIGIVKSDERTNKVVVTDLPEKIKEVEKIIKEYDSPSKQVLIEAKIVQVALSDEFKMGINWQSILNKLLIEKIFSTDTIDMTLSGVFETLSEVGVSDTEPFDNSVRASHPGGRALITGTLKDGTDFDAIVDILKTVGNTNLLSSPRILAINNQEAMINVGTREAFVTNTVVQNTTTSTTAENVTFVDVGIKLKVTPTIGEDGFVTLKIKPEVSNVAREILTSQGNTIPIVATQEAETMVMVKDGITVIMGGLIEDQQKKTTKKIPIIGSIPILGVPFRKQEDKILKNELVIFLTPRIVSGNVDLNTPSPEMVKYIEDVEQGRKKAGEEVQFKSETVPLAEPVVKGSNVKPRNK